MHIKTDKKKLGEYTKLLEKVTGKQLNLEVLKCILIDATTHKDKLALRATNLDVGIAITLKADIKKEGVAAVPATALTGFLENSMGPNAELKTSGGALHVVSEKSEATINTVPHEEFPTLPKTTGKKTTLPGTKLSEGLRSVWYAASTSSMKPELASVLVSGNGGKVLFAATDSFRLAEKTIQTDAADEFSPLLVPFKNVGELIRNLEFADEGESVSVVASENQALFSFGDINLTTRLVDGTFPDYKQIIPREHTTEATVLKQDLVQALRLTGVFVNRFNQVTFSVDPKKKTLTLTTGGGESGESITNIDAALSGDALQISFNQKYITDSFQSIEDDSVVLRLSGSSKPMIIKGVNDPSFTYLTMPMSR